MDCDQWKICRADKSLLLTSIPKENKYLRLHEEQKAQSNFTDIYCFIAHTTLHGHSKTNINLLFTELIFQVSKVENQKDMKLMKSVAQHKLKNRQYGITWRSKDVNFLQFSAMLTKPVEDMAEHHARLNFSSPMHPLAR